MVRVPQKVDPGLSWLAILRGLMHNVRTARVLSDRTIKEEIAKGRIVVEPPDQSCIQPASLDVHLDKKILAFIQVSAQNGDGAYLRRTAEGMG